MHAYLDACDSDDTFMFKVNEEGTEAAAATAMVMTLGCARIPKPPQEFILDRPFIFAIRDNVSGTVLFMGRYNQPE